MTQKVYWFIVYIANNSTVCPGVILESIEITKCCLNVRIGELAVNISGFTCDLVINVLGTSEVTHSMPLIDKSFNFNLRHFYVNHSSILHVIFVI